MFSCSKKCAVILSALLFFSGCVSKADSQLKEAESLLFEGHYREAVSKFLQVADRYPSTPQAEIALLKSGETFFLNLSEPEKAIKYFEKITLEFPKTESAKIAAGYIPSIYEKMLKDYDNAVIYYQKLIDNGGLEGNDFYQLAIARCFYKKGDYKQAIIEYKTLKSRYSDSDLIPEAEYQIGNCYFVMNNCEKAREKYDMILEKYSEVKWRYDILLSTGVCMEEKEEYDKALSIYRDIKDISPNKRLIEKKINAILGRVKNKNR